MMSFLDLACKFVPMLFLSACVTKDYRWALENELKPEAHAIILGHDPKRMESAVLQAAKDWGLFLAPKEPLEAGRSFREEGLELLVLTLVQKKGNRDIGPLMKELTENSAIRYSTPAYIELFAVALNQKSQLELIRSIRVDTEEKRVAKALSQFLASRSEADRKAVENFIQTADYTSVQSLLYGLAVNNVRTFNRVVKALDCGKWRKQSDPEGVPCYPFEAYRDALLQTPADKPTCANPELKCFPN